MNKDNEVFLGEYLMSKFLVSGYVGFDNFGDEAIVFVLAQKLKSQGAEKITWISSNPVKTASLYDVKAVGMFDFFKPMLECDIFISGGGSLLQDITSLKSLLYYLGLIFIALILRKKVIIYAQGFSEFRTFWGKRLTIYALKMCSEITVRDIQSQKLLARWNIESKLVPDPVWQISIPNQAQKQGVGVQLRNCENIDAKFLEILADNVAKNFAQQEIKLISLQDSIDVCILKEFQSLLKNKGVDSVIVSNLSVKQAIEVISNLEYLIAMRFHACLIGAKAKSKVLGISYDKKVFSLAENVNFPVLNLKEYNLDEGFNKLKKLNPNDYILPD